ncbi:uncharacterized protein Pyn_04498 [Prunus yedoensis var. nudiflora]|uniref:Uncharacterized protein n=1 Tax=Prunus yedoensis var. nudiflora TaxID=2094558 RepID=A0A314ZMI9_PRUYE|nr:uncharacterized protein Pyn_04498 [Prunus yedoensis var. nudiflora]
MEKRASTQAAVPLMMLLLLLWLFVFPALACPSDGIQCRDCVANQMKFGCPECTPVLRCMARCLWGGSSRANCVKRCNCGSGGKPKLSDCKKCMLRCKCNCMS